MLLAGSRPLHLIPGIGWLNVPASLLAWDVLVPQRHLVLNLVIVTYLLFALPRQSRGQVVGLVLDPAAIGIHTAFLYNGPAAPILNSAILAPRFIASALCSGPAVLLVLMVLLRRFTRFEISDAAIWKIAELMAYAMGVNLFLLGAEVFKEYYSDTEHLIHMRYMFTGVGGHTAIVPYMWLSVICSVVAFVLFLVPSTRRNPVTMLSGCVLIYIGVYVEKGMGLVIPGMTPDTLGEIYSTSPRSALWIAAGIFARIAGVHADGQGGYADRARRFRHPRRGRVGLVKSAQQIAVVVGPRAQRRGLERVSRGLDARTSQQLAVEVTRIQRASSVASESSAGLSISQVCLSTARAASAINGPRSRCRVVTCSASTPPGTRWRP